MCFDDHHKMGIGNATGQVTMWMGRLCCTGREGSRDWPVINVDPREVQVLKVKNCIPFMEAPQQSARLSYSPRPKAPRCWWHEYICGSLHDLFLSQLSWLFLWLCTGMVIMVHHLCACIIQTCFGWPTHVKPHTHFSTATTCVMVHLVMAFVLNCCQYMAVYLSIWWRFSSAQRNKPAGWFSSLQTV